VSATLNQVGRRLGGGGVSTIFFAILGLALLLWLATGIYTVAPAEQGALRLFGKFNNTSGPGLHWFWPAPIGTKNIEAVSEIRTMELGFRTTELGGKADFQTESRMITGDRNIVDVQLVVQYRINDLQSFLFEVDDPGEQSRGILEGNPEGRTLKDATEAALRLVAGQRSIDAVLTTEKDQVQADTKRLLQQLLDDYNTGLLVMEVKLQDVKAPGEVRDAFQDVVRARQEKDTLVNQAQEYQLSIIPQARGEAEQIVRAAEAFKQEKIERATGEAARFLAVLREYEKSREVTRQRLYLEAMETILPGVTKFIVSPEAGGNLLQFLPLQPGAQLPPLSTPASGASTNPAISTTGGGS
jgi:membrane protease subunit HflK